MGSSCPCSVQLSALEILSGLRKPRLQAAGRTEKGAKAPSERGDFPDFSLPWTNTRSPRQATRPSAAWPALSPGHHLLDTPPSPHYRHSGYLLPATKPSGLGLHTWDTSPGPWPPCQHSVSVRGVGPFPTPHSPGHSDCHPQHKPRDCFPSRTYTAPGQGVGLGVCGIPVPGIVSGTEWALTNPLWDG